ncbi:Uncharacterised protein [uncultured archaeon]|nr:Uncharacterised protein [uncultured archaeon]
MYYLAYSYLKLRENRRKIVILGFDVKPIGET